MNNNESVISFSNHPDGKDIDICHAILSYLKERNYLADESFLTRDRSEEIILLKIDKKFEDENLQFLEGGAAVLYVTNRGKNDFREVSGVWFESFEEAKDYFNSIKYCDDLYYEE